MIILTLVIVAYISYLAWQDMQYMQVNTHDVYIISTMSILLIHNLPSMFISAGLASILYYSKHFIGTADIIIITALTATIPFSLIPYWFLVIGISNLLMHQYKKRQIIPMLPSIALSYTIMQALSLWIK